MAIFLLLFELSARTQCMTWRVKFMRSKDVQKQLAQMSLNNPSILISS